VAVPLRRLLAEKVPLLALAAASAAVTVWAQGAGGAVQSLARYSWPERLGNAPVSYGEYLRQALAPVDLAPFYPHPGASLGVGWVAASALLLVVVTALVLWWGRRWPYLPVGWLWFLGTLVPVIGLVQVGLQGRADRYTYVPLVGVFLLAVWALADLAHAWRLQRPAAVLAGLGLVYYALTAWTQVWHWRNSGLLWEHTLLVTGGNSVACNSLGLYWLEKGNAPQAIPLFHAALRFDPNRTEAHINLGIALLGQGKLEEAAVEFEQAARLDSRATQPRTNLGVILLRLGKLEEAIAYLREAVSLNPDLAGGYYSLGMALQRGEKWAAAAACQEQAIRRDPTNSSYRRALAYVLHKQGRTEESRDQYQESLRFDPAWPDTIRAKVFRMAGNAGLRPWDAGFIVQEAEQVRQALGDQDAQGLDTLAVAYAAAGRFPEAAATARQARDRAIAAGQPDLARKIDERIHLFEKGQPFRGGQPWASR
jgi:tetratricopeptide (TPR) repeat protein